MSVEEAATAGFSALDWGVLILYFGASVAIGTSFYRRQTDTRDYFLAGRRISWMPIAISIIATDLSAISYMGIPALVYKTDLKYMLSALLFPLQMALVIVVFVPVLYRLNVYTVYEYLERRFNNAARLLASTLFLAGRGAWVATITFATAVVLAEITGMSVTSAILICGLTTTAYTLLGGLEAVIWTDVMQFFVLIGGALAIGIYVLLAFDGDVARIWSVASAGGHTELVDFSVDPTREYTFWGLLIGLTVYQVSVYGADQINVQRYFATKDLRQTIKATAGSAILLVPVLLLLYAIGIGLTAYYAEHATMRANLHSPDRVMADFTVNVLPAGLRGLVIAGIFAATMSSMSSGINSLTTSTLKDLLARIHSTVGQREMLWARLVTAFWGLSGTAGALLMVDAKLTILERFNASYTLFAGPMVGMFLLALLTTRATSWPTITAALLGFAVTSGVAAWTSVNWLWYAPTGCAITMTVGYLGSVVWTQLMRQRGPAVAGRPSQ